MLPTPIKHYTLKNRNKSLIHNAVIWIFFNYLQTHHYQNNLFFMNKSTIEEMYCSNTREENGQPKYNLG